MFKKKIHIISEKYPTHCTNSTLDIWNRSSLEEQCDSVKPQFSNFLGLSLNLIL